MKCKNIKVEDITPWHSDVFDHPDYRYVCELTGEEVIPYYDCRETRCKNYKPEDKS